jgi:hypothetical protein
MGEKVVVGPINSGWRTDRKPFVIDNDSFPTLINAYQWRGRLLRKRGTSRLARLTKFLASALPYTSVTSFTLSSGAANLFTVFSLNADAQLVPGSVKFTDSTAGNTYQDNGDGTLTGAPSGTGTVNYSTGEITVTGGASNTIDTVSFNYYPCLPVMGLEDFELSSSQYAKNISFDTTYSYNIETNAPHSCYNISFYKNPSSGGSYTAKTVWSPLKWNGQNYQQFWTINYQSAMWATNGINIPFNPTNVGMQYKAITTVTVLSPTTATLAITAHGLSVGDFVFVNEVVTTTGINFQTGYVTTVTDANNVIVTFPNANMATNGTGGIAQYLTNTADSTKDCMRWIDGYPVNGANPPVFTNGPGWVNFCPPLSKDVYSIGDKPAAKWYLVTARLIVPFKDRILFFGPVIQTSTAGSQTYIPDLVIYSQSGTPYYTASFQGQPESPTSITPVLVAGINTASPTSISDGQVGSPAAFFSDIPGFGGFVQAGIDEPITSVSVNEDVLIVGFTTVQTRFVYTGNDIIPFNFFLINSELGTQSTFSAVNFDDGVITVGTRGIIMTAQTRAERIDEDILDQLFQISLKNNGSERVTAQRDFIQEVIYFTSNSNGSRALFPNQTYLYNYREGTWARFLESYTTYGQFRKSGGYTWSQIGSIFGTWKQWNEPWNSGSSTLFQPIVIAGNQQGFVVSRDEGTNEPASLIIQGITGNTVTSPDHGLNNGDFVIPSAALGTISSQINGIIFKVNVLTNDTFQLLGPPITGGTYLGAGVITRMYRPFIQSKQFPTSWSIGRKTRLGFQQYLLTTTDNGQITLLIFLSQDDGQAYNDSNIVPSLGSTNNTLIYSTVVYTCPESTNLGLTPSNASLMMIAPINDSDPTKTASPQQQIWHRLNTSLIGDTVQVGFTLSDDQMFDSNFNSQFAEIELHGFILDVNPSQWLS